MGVNTFKFFILFIISILIISSCKKEDDEEIKKEEIRILGSTISTNINYNATMEAGKTYTIDGSIYVDGATLTIKEGVTLKFTKHSSLIFGVHQEGAKLIAIGTSSSPITITSAEYNKHEGDWNTIRFTSGSASGSILKYCNITYGGGISGGDNAAINIRDCSVSIENCKIEYSENRGVDLNNKGSFKSFKSNTIKDCYNEAISIYANKVHTIGINNTISGSPILVKAEDFEQEYTKTWKYQSVPFIIDGVINVYSAPGSKLVINAGNTIQFKENAKFSIGTNGTSGTIVANGTADSLITFTSDKENKYAGQWAGIYFDSGASSACVLNYCIIEYAGKYVEDTHSANINFNQVNKATYSKMDITNCSITNSHGYGIFIDSLSTPNLENNNFSNNNMGTILYE